MAASAITAVNSYHALDNEGNLLYKMDLDMGWKGMFYAQYEVLAPDNINVTKFNGGNFIYYGNMYRPESNEYIARMYGEGVSVDNWFYVGTGCVFVLDFYTDLSGNGRQPYINDKQNPPLFSISRRVLL